MKKENKKMAQERRAAERKKQATMRLVRNAIIIALIVAFFVGMIVYGVIDSRKQKAAEAEDAQQTTTDTSTQEDSTTQDSSDTTKTTLLTDTSLEVKEGDTVNIDYSGSIDGYVFQGGTAEGQDLTIGSNTFIDDFEEQLEGHKVGETVEVNVTFPENYGRSYTDDNGETKSFNGAEAVFTVKINGIYGQAEE